LPVLQPGRAGEPRLVDVLKRTAGVALGYFLLARLSVVLTPQSANAAVVWLPTGFLLGVSLLGPRRDFLLHTRLTAKPGGCPDPACNPRS